MKDWIKKSKIGVHKGGNKRLNWTQQVAPYTTLTGSGAY